MSLITPDFGLLFWMTLIFGIVFFVLAKFGFPVITDMVRKRKERIDQSIADARAIEARMAALAEEQRQMLDEARKEQSAILKEASETKARILAEAKEQARARPSGTSGRRSPCFPCPSPRRFSARTFPSTRPSGSTLTRWSTKPPAPASTHEYEHRPSSLCGSPDQVCP